MFIKPIKGGLTPTFQKFRLQIPFLTVNTKSKYKFSSLTCDLIIGLIAEGYGIKVVDTLALDITLRFSLRKATEVYCQCISKRSQQP